MRKVDDGIFPEIFRDRVQKEGCTPSLPAFTEESLGNEIRLLTY